MPALLCRRFAYYNFGFMCHGGPVDDGEDAVSVIPLIQVRGLSCDIFLFLFPACSNSRPVKKYGDQFTGLDCKAVPRFGEFFSLILLTTSACLCLQHSGNLGTTFYLSPVVPSVELFWQHTIWLRLHESHVLTPTDYKW